MVTHAQNSENNETLSPLELLRQQLGDEIDSGSELTKALQAIYTEMGLEEKDIDATIHVSLIDEYGNNAEQNIWKGDPEQFDMGILSKKFGSGAYRVKVYAKNHTGKKVKTAEKVTHWKLSAEDEAKRLTSPIAQQTIVTHADIAQMVADAMRANQPQANNLEQIIAIAKLLQPPAAPPVDQIAILKLGMEMAQGRAPQEAQARDPGSNTNDVIITMIDKFGGPIAALLAAAQMQQTQQNIAPSAGNAGTMIGHDTKNYTAGNSGQELSDNQQNTTQPTEEEMNLATQQLKMGVNLLVTQAMAGNPPETYAEMAVDNVPREALDTMLDQHDLIAWLSAIDSRVSNYADWFKEWAENVKNLLNLPPEPDEA